jgi:excisionase family DNA binding protein
MQTLDERLLTIADISEMLQVDRRSIYRWIRSGELGVYDVGREYRVSESQLQEFLEDRRRTKAKRQ